MRRGVQVYRCMLKDGTEVKVDNPAELPDDSVRDYILEPYVRWVCQLAMPLVALVPLAPWGLFFFLSFGAIKAMVLCRMQL